MTGVVSYVRELTHKPWLIVGKGPTVDRVTEIDTSLYHCLTLNHACAVVVPDVAHFVDLEAMQDCMAALLRDECRAATRLCVPWHPHVKCSPTKKTLEQCKLEEPILTAYAGADRLLSYNATTAGKLKAAPFLPVVRLRYFSAVAAFNILAMAGVHEVFSIGVDGGVGYGRVFDTKDRLANGRKSFDDQTREILETCRRFKIHWIGLGR